MNAEPFLVSAKTHKNAPPTIQRRMGFVDALNLLRSAILGLQPMDESSADLQAMKMLDELTNGTTDAKAIENLKTGAVVVFQLAG